MRRYKMAETSIKFTEASLLEGPRTYFTLLDGNNLKTVENKKEYMQMAEDTLKVLLLTKDNIVIAASHLITQEAFSFFRGKEKLLQDGVVLPALRSEFNNFEEMYYDKLPSGDKDIPDFFNSTITNVIPWKLSDNSGWFKDRIKEEIAFDSSILRKNLRLVGAERRFISLIENNLNFSDRSGGYFSREKLVDDIERLLPREVAGGLKQWIDMLYYISGARVVNCENYLPQENYVHYNLATLGKGRHILSEAEIFHSILISTILSTIYNEAYPINILKNLSFDDILNFRSVNIEKSISFRKKYEDCLSLWNKSRIVMDKEELLLNMQQLGSLADDLQSTFSTTLHSELRGFKRIISRQETFDKAFDLAVNFIGIFYLPVSVINFVINNCVARKLPLLDKHRRAISDYYHMELRRFVANEYNNDPALLDYINDIILLHKSKYLKKGGGISP
jgi:hypothetical protein